MNSIEPLETRIAPAILFTYTELDGDLVTVSISKGNLGDATFTHPPVPGLFGDQLQMIDLNGNPVFKGANIVVTAKPQDLTGNGVIRGDGLANVGFIDASGIDLGTIWIRGDLVKITAGDTDLTTPGLAALKALSVARFGTETGAPDTLSIVTGRLGGITVTTDFAGVVTAGTIGSVTIGGNFPGAVFSDDDIGSMKIGGDFRGSLSGQDKLAGITIGGSMIGGLLLINGDTGPIKIADDFRTSGAGSGFIQIGGKLAAITIGGSFLAGPGSSSGRIASGGDMGVVTIGEDLRCTGAGSGNVFSGGKLAGVKIGGSIFGGTANSANIHSIGDMGAVQIAGDLIGGTGDNSARIVSDGKLASVTIGGSIIGSSGNFSGHILSAGAMGALKIAGDLRGGSPLNGGDPSIDGSGYVEAQRIGSVFVAGSIVTGFDFNAADAPTKNASIRVRDDIGSLVVKGSLIGNSAGDDVEVIISARGKAGVGAGVKTDIAIGKISIGGGLTFARILAGFDVELAGANADAQVGVVTIGGDVLSSSIIAGVQPGADGFGNFDDAKLSGAGVKDNTDGLGAVSRIASIVIKGQALGTLASGDGTVFGIEAQQLGAIKIAGTAIFLRPGAGNDLFNTAYPLGSTRTPGGDGFDFHAFEVA